MTEQQWLAHYSDIVVQHDIPALDSSVRKNIQKAIETKLLKAPFHFGKPLRYSKHHLRSLRMGDYRILYAIDDSIVSIVAIGHRKEIYTRVE